jgi:hypothetical protein
MLRNRRARRSDAFDPKLTPAGLKYRTAARLVTRPILTGSSPTEKTIGIVVVAALAATAATQQARNVATQ